MRYRIWCVVLTVVAALTPSTTPRAHGFDGITILELADETIGHDLLGHTLGAVQRFIVTFVSPRGTYASLAPWQSIGGERGCVAWAQAETRTGESITFGLPPSEQTQKLVNPPVCKPFKLSLSGSGGVRFEAGRKSEVLRIAARIPFVDIDWNTLAASRYTIKGVPLGPLPVVRKALPANAEFKLGPLERSVSYLHKGLVITIPTDNRTQPMTILGRVAAAEVLGWSLDTLQAAQYYETLASQALSSAFDAAVIERYGQPTMRVPGIKETVQEFYWLFDLRGRQIPRSSISADNCLSTRDHWVGLLDLAAPKTDVGPWACSLILVLSYESSATRIVRGYTVWALSGYVLGMNHFARRLEEVAATRQKIGDAQRFKPKL